MTRQRISKAAGLDVVPRRELSPAEENTRLRASLAKAGQAGEAILNDALGKGTR